ncbi:MAG: putative glycoside hydrolase [Patescibacteria group bacterium]|nr:putative glycoside hydrolase [Patescibacteria group bacterium]
MWPFHDEPTPAERRAAALAKIRDFILRHGALIVFLAALPAMAYFDATLFYQRQIALESFRPDWGAVRTDDGPGLPPPIIPGVEHQPLPEKVKGLYLTSDGYGNKIVLERVLGIAKRTEINALVIDLKDSKYELAFKPRDEALNVAVAKKPSLGDLRELSKRLHAEGLYLIARVPVFQDSALVAVRPKLAVRQGGAVWRDNRGIRWLDPASQEVWEYNAAIAREAYESGFDEVQFDYIRFPSDGNLKGLQYPFYDGERPKHEVLGEFFAYLDLQLRQKQGIPISVDLFGLTMWQHEYDLNIGQMLRDALPHFDFISPMVYPSHYADGFQGFANPAEHPYEVVRDNMIRGQKLIATMKAEAEAKGEEAKLATYRPWLQDFDMGATYDANKVRLQIRASDEQGASGWLLWNAANVYTESALERERAVR